MTKATICCVLGVACLLLSGSLGCGQPRPEEQGEQAEMIVTLPEPQVTDGMPLVEAIQKRRSIRTFTGEGLPLAQLGQIAWAAQGITEPTRGLRAAPSAGATYPIEMYLVTPEGMFHYIPDGHRMRRVTSADKREALSHACLGQRQVADAAVNVVMTAVFDRIEPRYRERARMYTYMEAGHIAQNVYLQSVALDLGSVAIGAFREAAVSEALQLPAEHEPVYIVSVGIPR